jgi:chemotaxis protein methyltransferase CheR
LKLKTYSEYIDFIFGNNGRDELELLRDLLSTNMTYFYRESAHFDFLQSVIDKARANQNFNIWSAACSGGDEVYTIASIFEEYSKPKNLSYNILGTDISNRMISQANAGKYMLSRMSKLPLHLTRNHFTRSMSDGNVWFSANENLRRHIRFQEFNLIKDIPLMNASFDIIFCRHVLIYFNNDTKARVVNELIKRLKPGGYLIFAHCEGMLGRGTSLVHIQPAVFQKAIV